MTKTLKKIGGAKGDVRTKCLDGILEERKDASGKTGEVQKNL